MAEMTPYPILLAPGADDDTSGRFPGGMPHVAELFHTMGTQDVLERNTPWTSPPTARVEPFSLS